MSEPPLFWPAAVESFNYYPPEAIVQVPMDVFERALKEAPEERHPKWAREALESGESHTLMRADTFYELLGNLTEAPQWMVDYVEEQKRREGLEHCPECGARLQVAGANVDWVCPDCDWAGELVDEGDEDTEPPLVPGDGEPAPLEQRVAELEAECAELRGALQALADFVGKDVLP